MIFRSSLLFGEMKPEAGATSKTDLPFLLRLWSIELSFEGVMLKSARKRENRRAHLKEMGKVLRLEISVSK